MADPEGLERLAALVPVAPDESLLADPALAQRWSGWQVRRPASEGGPRPLLAALQAGAPNLCLSTAFETGIGRRLLAHLAALQAQGPTPTAPGLAPGCAPRGSCLLRTLSGCGGRWGEWVGGSLGGGDLMEGAGMGRVWLLRMAIHTVLGMAGDGRNPWNLGTLTRR